MLEENSSTEVSDCGEEGAPKFDDERDLILARLLYAHETYFNVVRNYEYADRMFPGYAEFHSHGEKYVLVKRAKLWEVDSHEYIFFDCKDQLSEKDLAAELEFMKNKGIEKVVPEPNHMSSFISLVLVVNSVETGLEKQIAKARFHKEFKYGIQGWADLRLVVVDLSERVVLTNAAGKEMKASVEANAGFERSKKSFFTRR